MKKERDAETPDGTENGAESAERSEARGMSIREDIANSEFSTGHLNAQSGRAAGKCVVSDTREIWIAGDSFDRILRRVLR